MKLENIKGFTIIELIVVIAIISVLTSIIVPVANLYKSKSREVAIKNEFSQLATFGTTYYEKYGGYTGFCNALESEPFFIKISDFALVAEDQVHCDNGSKKWKVCCDEKESAWAACVKLVIDESTAWCADSTGIRKQITNEQCKSKLAECP